MAMKFNSTQRLVRGRLFGATGDRLSVMTDKEVVHHLDEILEMAATSDATTEKQDDALRYAVTRLTNKPEQRLIRAVVAGMEYNPGHSDLDDEQPITVRMTLGDYRLACRLAQPPPPTMGDVEFREKSEWLDSVSTMEYENASPAKKIEFNRIYNEIEAEKRRRNAPR